MLTVRVSSPSVTMEIAVGMLRATENCSDVSNIPSSRISKLTSKLLALGPNVRVESDMGEMSLKSEPSSAAVIVINASL